MNPKEWWNQANTNGGIVIGAAAILLMLILLVRVGCDKGGLVAKRMAHYKLTCHVLDTLAEGVYDTEEYLFESGTRTSYIYDPGGQARHIKDVYGNSIISFDESMCSVTVRYDPWKGVGIEGAGEE